MKKKFYMSFWGKFIQSFNSIGPQFIQLFMHSRELIRLRNRFRGHHHASSPRPSRRRRRCPPPPRRGVLSSVIDKRDSAPGDLFSSVFRKGLHHQWGGRGWYRCDVVDSYDVSRTFMHELLWIHINVCYSSLVRK